MHRECDYVLVGTGTAALICAKKLIEDGFDVILLNPLNKFFKDNSETALDENTFNVFQEKSSNQELQTWLDEQKSEKYLKIINPEFPGAVALWPKAENDFYDLQTPRVFVRDRIWLFQKKQNLREDLSGKGIRIVDGTTAVHMVPGVSKSKIDINHDFKGVLASSLCDVEINKYQDGLLKFVEHKIGKLKIAYSVSKVEFQNKTTEFYVNAQKNKILYRKRLILFLNSCIIDSIAAVKKQLIKEIESHQLQLNTYYSFLLKSKENISPRIMAIIENAAIYAHHYDENSKEIVLFWKKSKMPYARKSSLFNELLSETDFQSVSKILENILGWQKFTILKFDLFNTIGWHEKPRVLQIKAGSDYVWAVTHTDGFLLNAIKSAHVAHESAYEGAMLR